MKLEQIKIVCPQDGSNIFVIMRDGATLAGASSDSTYCPKCEPGKHLEYLKTASKITLLP